MRGDSGREESCVRRGALSSRRGRDGDSPGPERHGLHALPKNLALEASCWRGDTLVKRGQSYTKGYGNQRVGTALSDRGSRRTCSRSCDPVCAWAGVCACVGGGGDDQGACGAIAISLKTWAPDYSDIRKAPPPSPHLFSTSPPPPTPRGGLRRLRSG